ncbi:MAG: TadA family conjugal transfer-associated ATPase, partial [Candidatus Nanopelagicales bacterium]|nr:TadA family conjugal transfer-associated ATPase [Candidatus Nanopelagicales bacterium]
MQSTISARIRNRLVREGGVASHDRVAQALSNEGIVLSEDALRHLVVELEQEFNGAGILQPLIDTPGVTDILVNGTEYIWWDRGSGMERTALCFESEADVRRYAQRLANIAGRRLDDASPLVDAQLPDGTRVHCVLAPIAVAGTSISLRIPSATTLTLEHLRDQGSIDGQVHEVLLSIMQSRLAFVVSGGTGSGKTTILSALLAHVPHDHRIVIVEDSSELNPRHPHVVRLQSRLANVEGAGAITMRELVRNSLRMRPTRIVVGEVRGAEVVDLLSALNTGHEGGCGTVHANSPTDVPTRLEALGLTAGLDRIALHALMGAGLDAIVH